MSRAKRSILSWLVLSPLIGITLLPFAVMISTSLKPHDEVLAYPPTWLPKRVAWENFVDMWDTVGFGQAAFNSVLIAVAATVLALVIAVPAAYAMSRLPMKGRGAYRHFLLVRARWPIRGSG